MGRFRWRYLVAVALTVYVFGFVFWLDMFSSRTGFMLGVVLLFTLLGLWFRFRNPPEARDPSSSHSDL